MKTILAFLTALVLAVPAFAGTIQGSATVDPQSTAKNPVLAGVAIQDNLLRVGVQFATPRRVFGNLDLVAYSNDTGFEAGVGLVVENLGDYSSTEGTETDSTVTVQKHDNGKHKGDKHNHGKKVVTTTSTGSVVLTVGDVNVKVVPSLFIGIAAPAGLFVESRVLFDGGDVSNRVTVGVRF